MTTERPRTVVDFVDTTPHDTGHAAKRVRINGTEVLVESGTIDLTFSDNEVTKITLTLLPTEVHFIHEEPLIAAEEPEKPLLIGDWVEVQPEPKMLSGAMTTVPSRLKEGAVGQITGGPTFGNFYVRIGERAGSDAILGSSLKRVEEPRPLQVGDTVRVSKDATYNMPGVSSLPLVARARGLKAEIRDLDDGRGNLRLAVDGRTGFLALPHQVTRVES